jgi:hypothetical protein
MLDHEPGQCAMSVVGAGDRLRGLRSVGQLDKGRVRGVDPLRENARIIDIHRHTSIFAREATSGLARD